MTNINYGAQSVQHLSFVEGARKRIGVYLGSADNDGVMNGLLEIINNSTDEAHAGFGKKIEVTIWEKSAMVTDYGRGIPRGSNEHDKEVMITLLTENHSGAKFDKEAYSGFSRGLNGSGMGATCVSSDWMEVTSRRDGGEFFLRLEEGVPLTPTAKKVATTKKTGTTVKWQPAQSVFSTENIKFDFNKICDIIEEYSYFNLNIEFVVTNGETNEVKKFKSKNGLSDFAKNKILKGIHKTPIHYNYKSDEVEVEIIAKWTGLRERYYLFVNGAECPEGGTPITGAKTSITRTINNITKSKFSGDIVRKGFIYIISIKHKNPIFANQIKSKVSNAELRGICDKAFGEAITEFKTKHTEEFGKVIDILTKSEKAEKAAEKAREAVMNATKEINKKGAVKTVHSDKLKNARKLGLESTLLVLEGETK